MKMPRQRAYPTHPHAQEMIELYKQGFSFQEIGKKFGCYGSIVKYQLVKFKVPLRPRYYRSSAEIPQWRGDEASSASIHRWVRKRLPKPEVCPECELRSAYDLANIENKPNPKTYNRELKNWRWLCRYCHMIEDGRMNNLKKGFPNGVNPFKDSHTPESIEKMRQRLTKPYCGRGHKMKGRNVYYAKSGKRSCMVCIYLRAGLDISRFNLDGAAVKTLVKVDDNETHI